MKWVAFYVAGPLETILAMLYLTNHLHWQWWEVLVLILPCAALVEYYLKKGIDFH